MNMQVKESAPVVEIAKGLPGAFAEPGFEQAQMMASQGQVEAALHVYAQIGAAQAAKHFEDALAMERRNDTGGAQTLLKRCVAADPTHYTAWMKLAALLSGRDAEQACRAALAVKPGDFDASLRLARLQTARNCQWEADETLAAIRLAENDIEQAFALASLWLQIGELDQAERHFRRCIAIDKTDVRPYAPLLELLNRLDKLAEAEQLCRDYLAVRPGDQLVRANLVQVQVRQKRWAEAEAGFIELLTELPGWVQLRQLYADMLEKCGREAEAAAIHEKNVAMAPNNPEAYLKLADSQHKAGQREAALATCRQVAAMYAREGNWGLHMLPNPLATRLIFNQMETIAARYCTGQRALIDNTGIRLQDANFGFGEVVELFCMVVGQEHIDYLEQVAYPALAATEDFDRLLREHKVLYNIYTTPGDYPLLRGFLSRLDARGIPYRVNVELLAFTQDLYSILALPIIDQVKRSLALRSAVVMSLPDAIISGSIYRVLKDMKPYETVVCAMPRIDSVVAYPELKRKLEEAGKLDSREFVRQAMTEFMHPQTHLALKNDSNCLRYRDHGTYYSAQNWAPPPLCFHARPEMLDHMLKNPLCGPNSTASFYAIDHDFVESAFRTGNLRLIGDSDYFFWAELTHPARHNDFLSGRPSENYYYPEASRHVYEHQFKWVYGG